MLNRRQAVSIMGASLAVAGGAVAAPAGPLADLALLLPSASQNGLGLKLWTTTPQADAPRVTIDGAHVQARPLGSRGRVWRYAQGGLAPGRAYRLAVEDASGRAMRAPWTLKTLPAPGQPVDRVRLLIFSCAGGDETYGLTPGRTGFLAMAVRRALLDRALSFTPDLAIVVGDHVYWDQDSSQLRAPAAAAAIRTFQAGIAPIEKGSVALSAANAASVETIVERQIATLYGDRLAETPTLFIADDHDYFENDQAGTWGATFPPDPFHASLQKLSADLAYPHPLNRPSVGMFRSARSLERLRYGDLLELLAYDCRFDVRQGKDARFLSGPVEAFVRARTRENGAAQLIHAPSTPFGWTAGKWGEWYEDRGRGQGNFGDDKDYWQAGWFEQHQRLMRALSLDQSRAAIAISGDLHASAAARMMASGDLDLSANPVHTVLPGALGTGDGGWPSVARGEFPWTPARLRTEPLAALEERNGFAIVDVEREQVTVQLFCWRPPEPVDAIATLEPRARVVIEAAG